MDVLKPKILVATLFRNNSTYIPYYLACCKMMEEANAEVSFQYLWFTNDNEDDTEALLRDQQVLTNANLTVQNFDEKQLNKRRILRLAEYRQFQLEQLKRETAELVLFIDTEVFFNGTMFKTMYQEMLALDADAMTPFTVNKLGFYHDTFAHISSDGKYMKASENSPLTLIKRHLWANRSSVTQPVRSAFNGFYLCRKSVLDIPDLTYITAEPACEHLIFNQKLISAGKKIFVTNEVTPVMCAIGDYRKYFEMIQANRSDLRDQLLTLRNLLNFSLSDLIKEIRRLFKKNQWR